MNSGPVASPASYAQILMKLYSTILFFTLFCNDNLLAQNYCSMRFCYIGTIINDSTNIYTVGIPNTRSLYETDGLDSLTFTSFKIQSKKFKLVSSGAGCSYCNAEFVMHSIIRKGRKSLPIQLFVETHDKPLIIFVPFSKIKFIPIREKSEYAFIIDLGSIQL